MKVNIWITNSCPSVEFLGHQLHVQAEECLCRETKHSCGIEIRNLYFSFHEWSFTLIRSRSTCWNLDATQADCYTLCVGTRGRYLTWLKTRRQCLFILMMEDLGHWNLGSKECASFLRNKNMMEHEIRLVMLWCFEQGRAVFTVLKSHKN